MKYWSSILLILAITNCTNKMDIKSIPYNNQLKKTALSEITFNTISLEQIPEPFFKDYSHHKSASAKSHKSYDTMGFRDILLKQLSTNLGDTVLRLIVITPNEEKLPFDAFAFLFNKNIVAMHLAGNANFKLWMEIIFERQYEQLEEYKTNGQFDKQPELNPNPRFMLSLAKGEFSQKWVNSGMLVDERPFENTGAYLYKKAPKQYNEAKIAKEKQNYLKKYIDTSGTSLNLVELQELFNTFIATKNLRINTPENNEHIYNEFESLANYQFPDELKALLSKSNGIENNGFLTAEQVLTEWKNWKVIYDDPNWMLVDLTGNNLPDGRKTISMYTNPYWIPFLSIGGGNFLAIDYAPGSKGTSGQIIAFGADENKIRFIAEDMTSFLQMWINGKDVLNNGF